MYVKVIWRGVERSLPGAVTTRRCLPGVKEGVASAGSGEVPTRGRHNLFVAIRSKGRGIASAGSGEDLHEAVTIRPCPPGAKEGVGQLQELERSLNRDHHGRSLPIRTEVNTNRSPDTWKPYLQHGAE